MGPQTQSCASSGKECAPVDPGGRAREAPGDVPAEASGDASVGEYEARLPVFACPFGPKLSQLLPCPWKLPEPSGAKVDIDGPLTFSMTVPPVVVLVKLRTSSPVMR